MWVFGFWNNDGAFCVIDSSFLDDAQTSLKTETSHTVISALDQSTRRSTIVHIISSLQLQSVRKTIWTRKELVKVKGFTLLLVLLPAYWRCLEYYIL